MVNVQSFGDKNVGRKRKNNEDFVTWFEPMDPVEIEASGSLYILADGVGGAAKGERASQYAAQKVLHEYYQHSGMEPGERLRRLMEQASSDIFTHAEQSGQFQRMATTMVAAIVRAEKLIVANVGDSRAYLIREGKTTQLTRDHSIVGEMVANGDMTEAEAQASKIKNRLTRSIGGEAEVHVDVYPTLALQPGDRILLCSDGLTRYALQADIARMAAEGSPQEIVERLIKFANQRGGADNVSAIVVSYKTSTVPEPTIQNQRPKPIDWDTLATMHDIKKRKPIAMSWAPIVISGIALGLILGFILIVVFINQKQAAISSTNSTHDVASSMPVPSETLSFTPSSEPTKTPSPIPTNSATFIPPVVETPSGTWIPVNGKVIADPFLYVRNGPGTQFSDFAKLNFGQSITVIGENMDNTWLFVSSSSLEKNGWVSSDFVLIEQQDLNLIRVLNVFTPTPSPPSLK